jgi:uncharacterized protein
MWSALHRPKFESGNTQRGRNGTLSRAGFGATFVGLIWYKALQQAQQGPPKRPMVQLERLMLRDDRGDGGRRPVPARNVLGEPLELCSLKPTTGFYRDGCCNTGPEDVGSHTVCVVMTAEFLAFSKLRGNDLSTPVPEFGFPGLKPGDRWCLCAPRWQEALEANQAPRVVLRATHEGALTYCKLANLKRLAVDLA